MNTALLIIIIKKHTLTSSEQAETHEPYISDI